jgi:hypothetical protein
MFDGKFACKYVPGGTPRGKGGTPEAKPKPDDASEGLTGDQGLTGPASGGAIDPNACRPAMVGTPPNCRCPPNSELLGGTCVRYTASTCSNALAVDALPKPAAARGKTLVQMREDGLKDCCCVTYDQFWSARGPVVSPDAGRAAGRG